MATQERNSKVIEGEMDALKKKIRALEAERQEKQKAVEKAKKQRTTRAFAAHADGDKQAAEQLARARETQVKAALEMEDVDSAINQGRAMFADLEREWKRRLADEAWADLIASTTEGEREAALIDQAAAALAALMSAHGTRIDLLKRNAHNLQVERAFATMGLRHADRIFAWKMIQSGFAGEFEKPSEPYREASGYAAIFAEQVAAARAIWEAHRKEREASDPAGAADTETATAEGATD